MVSLAKALSSTNLTDLAQIVFMLLQFETGRSESTIKNRAKNRAKYVHFTFHFRIFHGKSIQSRNVNFACSLPGLLEFFQTKLEGVMQGYFQKFDELTRKDPQAKNIWISQYQNFIEF